MRPFQILRHKIVPGRDYRTPKEVWGFRLARSSRSPAKLARIVLSTNAELIGLRGVLRTLRRRAVKRSIGGWHVIFDQRLFGHRVHRAYVTVHMNRDRQVYLVKNRAVPNNVEETLQPDRHELGLKACRELAVRSLSHTTGPRRVMDAEKLWFPVRDRLRPAFKFRVLQQSPRHEWIVYVDAVRGTILWKYDNLALASGYARIFNPNPVIALGDWRQLLDKEFQPLDPPKEAYKNVRLRGLDDSGFLDGVRVTTNLTKPRVKRQPNLRWEFDSNQRGFDEAMIYFHLDSAIQYVERLGYRGECRISRGRLPRTRTVRRRTARGTARGRGRYCSARATSTRPKMGRRFFTSLAMRCRTRSVRTSASRRRLRPWVRGSATTSRQASPRRRRSGRHTNTATP